MLDIQNLLLGPQDSIAIYKQKCQDKTTDYLYKAGRIYIIVCEILMSKNITPITTMTTSVEHSMNSIEYVCRVK